jgi:hypothetical protein
MAVIGAYNLAQCYRQTMITTFVAIQIPSGERVTDWTDGKLIKYVIMQTVVKTFVLIRIYRGPKNKGKYCIICGSHSGGCEQI